MCRVMFWSEIREDAAIAVAVACPQPGRSITSGPEKTVRTVAMAVLYASAYAEAVMLCEPLKENAQ